MSSHREGVNPLRPYYIPPSIGEPSEPVSAPNPAPFSRGNATGKYASRARDIFSDIDYKDYLSEPSPSVVQTVKELIDELLWKYASVLMAQPFEVAKTILQVRSQDDIGALGLSPVEDARLKPPTPRSATHAQYPDSDSDPDEPAYFTSNLPSTPTPAYPRQPKRTPTSPLESPRIPGKPSIAPHQLNIRRPDSVLDVISQLWQKEGAWGVWKGSNATFIYAVLQSLMENWSRSLLSALFNVPDIGLSKDMDRMIDIAAPYPWASLFVAAAAAVATGLILSPLDLVRTRLVTTSTSRKPRRTLSTLRALPSYLVPPTLIIPTVLHSLIHPLLTLSAPLVLRTRFMVNRELSPMTFSVAKFCSSSLALFVKLPLETVLRRGQLAVLSSPSYVRALDIAGGSITRVRSRTAEEKSPAPVLETIVPPGRYDGVFGTMYTIVSEEGSRPVVVNATGTAKGKAAAAKKTRLRVAETVYQRGQGLDGLWRGWKVSWWGLVGLWTAGVLGGGGDGEF